MAIPGAMMPGQGGPPPPPGAGGPPGAPGGGGPDPSMIMQILAGLQGTPPQKEEPPIFQEATNALGMLLQRLQTRSAKAAKGIADALAKVQQAKVDLANESQKAMQPPPDLGLTGGMGSAPGSMGPGGM